MQKIYMDETKLPKVMEMIKKAAALMEEKDCKNDGEAKKELEELQKQLREISGNPRTEVWDFREYWEYTDLETVARKALMTPPVKEDVTDDEIKEIVLTLLSHNEAEMDWWLAYLEVNTGLYNLSDYIFYPNLVGLDKDAELAEIADKIIADKNN